MDISFIISELLYVNDCVIIPEFGGFVATYAPARIHPSNHGFLPPSKNILFNSKLVRDDGLLIDSISRRQNISYARAKVLVEDFTRDALKKLSNGEMVRFKNIGSLHRDSLGKVLFSPDDSVNYLEEAFGLPGFVSPPIRRPSVHKRVETEFIDRKPAPGYGQRRRKRNWAYAAVIPVLVLLGWFIFFGNFQIMNTQQSGILTISDSELKFNPETKPVLDPMEISTPPLESLDFSAGAKNVESLSDTEAESPPDIKKYYIIGGAFGVELNADNLIAVLRKKGYAAERAGLSPSGLHMVSYFSTGDKSEALINLEIIRSSDNPSAWLIRQ